MSLFSFFSGSRPSDLQSIPEHKSPLEPCPDSPNCILHNAEFPVDPEKLFNETVSALESMSPYSLEKDSQRFQINSVFRIRFFGFRDDLKAVIRQQDERSVLYIRSSSREGYSDLGVNRRRVEKLLSRLSHLKTV